MKVINNLVLISLFLVILIPNVSAITYEEYMDSPFITNEGKILASTISFPDVNNIMPTINSITKNNKKSISKYNSHLNIISNDKIIQSVGFTKVNNKILVMTNKVDMSKAISKYNNITDKNETVIETKPIEYTLSDDIIQNSAIIISDTDKTKQIEFSTDSAIYTIVVGDGI